MVVRPLSLRRPGEESIQAGFSRRSVPNQKSASPAYFGILRAAMKDKLPAIIPQVYLHYDPGTIRELPNGSPLVRQRLDFLLLLSYRQCVVIELTENITMLMATQRVRNVMSQWRPRIEICGRSDTRSTGLEVRT